jgi:hypothetical protein
MALEHETAQQVKSLLRDDTDGTVSGIRARLDPLFGEGNGWLDESDAQLETNLGSWLTDSEAGRLTVLATGATDAAGVADLIAWFDDLLDRWDTANQESDQAAQEEPRFTYITGVEGYPGWWQAFDTAEPDVDGGYKYVRGTQPPTDQTTGWMARTEAFAAMQSTTHAVAQSTETGAVEATPDAGETTDSAISDIVIAAVDEVDGAEDLTPEEIEQALNEAIGELTK